ncbi:protein of unknown function [Mesotoga infera]|uniref:Uncharacterized protein n=1 Tax=Mesotoga infera TaxID=1236046 RepID=A0A7Z7LH49_9BACT|nr:protein of unknown function [Mesotoga infera]
MNYIINDSKIKPKKERIIMKKRSNFRNYESLDKITFDIHSKMYRITMGI